MAEARRVGIDDRQAAAKSLTKKQPNQAQGQTKQKGKTTDGDTSRKTICFLGQEKQGLRVTGRTNRGLRMDDNLKQIFDFAIGEAKETRINWTCVFRPFHSAALLARQAAMLEVAELCYQVSRNSDNASAPTNSPVPNVTKGIMS